MTNRSIAVVVSRVAAVTAGLASVILLAAGAVQARQPVPAGSHEPLQPLTAQPPAGQSQPRPAQEEYLPVKSLPDQEKVQESLPAAPLVMGAYAFVWVVLLVYVWSIWRRLGKVQREIGDLERRVRKHAGE
jgi:CcmD family protein